MRRARDLLHAALALAVLAEATVLVGGAYFQFRQKLAMIKPGSALPSLQGYGLDFEWGVRAAPSDCAIYRVASYGCVSCRNEAPAWQEFWVKSGNNGACAALEVLPGFQLGQFTPRGQAVPQLVWVPLEWARAADIVVIPTTILASRGRILWVHEGAMGAQDFAELRTQVTRLSKR